MTKKFFQAAAFFFLTTACSMAPTVSIQTREVSSVGQCPISTDYPPLFNVIENNQNQILVQLGDFSSFFHLSEPTYKFKIYFRGSKENKEDKDQFIQEGEGEGITSVKVPVRKTGVYYFVVFENEKSPVWKQKVFAIAPAEHVLTAQDKKDLAEKYAPILSTPVSEQYFPVSLEYLTNQVETDAQLAREPFVLTNKKIRSLFSFNSKPELELEFAFSDLTQILPYYGHSESVLKSGLESSAMTRLKSRFGQNHVTVYYSVFENPKWKEIYINYHFFFSYDPKNGTKENDVLAAHIFDRESMTVVLRSTSRQPLMVFYGAHLASQTMGQLDSNGDAIQKWNSGRVFVNWPEVNKISNRPVPALALGSHGVYPKKGYYAVFINNFKLLVEPAGGDRLLYPELMTDFKKSANSYTYKLKDLQLDQVSSDCQNPNRFLAFSGSTVDVFGPVNATFPPYTDREEDYFSYADPNAPMFDMSK